MTITPGTYNFTIYQGATFTYTLTWKDDAGTPIDITGFTAVLQFRESRDASTTFLTLSTAAGGITLGGAAGTITLAISATDTTAITVTGGVYDLKLTSGAGVVTRLLEGEVLISKEVTR